ncbi:tyrosine-type recombinase/integrase [Nonomuraea cavernae]|uniref:tyrosine-type recombinase/integrase n=1 Tax=Nonomuraea cavernae TaxID=2045107 RepID=UPI0033F8A7CA
MKAKRARAPRFTAARPGAGGLRAEDFRDHRPRLGAPTDPGRVCSCPGRPTRPPPIPPTAHVLRHTLATTLVRGKTDLVLVAEILGHARLETTRRYSLPSDKDKEDALKLITVDR